MISYGPIRSPTAAWSGDDPPFPLVDNGVVSMRDHKLAKDGGRQRAFPAASCGGETDDEPAYTPDRAKHSGNPSADGADRLHTPVMPGIRSRAAHRRVQVTSRSCPACRGCRRSLALAREISRQGMPAPATGCQSCCRGLRATVLGDAAQAAGLPAVRGHVAGRAPDRGAATWLAESLLSSLHATSKARTDHMDRTPTPTDASQCTAASGSWRPGSHCCNFEGTLSCP